MPLYKAWDVHRRKRKAVTATGYEEFVQGGKFSSISNAKSTAETGTQKRNLKGKKKDKIQNVSWLSLLLV